MSTSTSVAIEVSAEPHTIEQFFKFCSEGKLMAVKCRKCSKLMTPPRPFCSNCGSGEADWMQLKGSGTISTYTIIHVAPPEMAMLAPYAVAIVRLDEGTSLPGMVRYVEPMSVKIGMRVQVEYEAPAADKWPRWTQYYFKPV